MIPNLEFLDRRADFLDHARQLVAKRHARPGIRHRAVVKVKVRPADAGSGDADDRILGMPDFRHRFLVNADPQRSAIIHGSHRRSTPLAQPSAASHSAKFLNAAAL
jgi:hypothetical protein